jgi:hypothetical protein
MSEERTPSLEGFAGYRAASVLWSKLVDAAAVIILIRALPREDYGIVGLAAGWLVALGFLNLAPENILWRDYRKMQPSLPKFLGACAWFAILKTVVFCLLAFVVALAHYGVYREPMLLAYLPAAALFGGVTTLAFIFELPLVVGFHYRGVAALTMVLRAGWLVLLATLFWRPSLSCLMGISAVYYGVHVAAWFVTYRRHGSIRWRQPPAELREIIVAVVREFVIWQHLASAARAFLLRGALALLGLLGIALADVGNYLVAVNVAAFALILPGVFEMAAAAGLAHSANAANDARIVRRTSAWNFAVTALQLVLFALMGEWLLRFLVRNEAAVVMPFAWPLLLGASLFGLQTPALAFAIARAQPAALFWRVYLPTALVAIAGFCIGAVRWGLVGIAWAHVVNAVVLAVALWLHLRRART